MLKCLGDLSRFKKLKSIRIFVVYAHDNSKTGIAHQDCVRNLIEWLREVRTNVLSDKSPVLENLDCLHPAAAGDIVENQIRLLPTWKMFTKTEGIVKIDKVVLCSSQVLRNYYESSFASSYIQKVEALCTAQHDITAIKSDVKDLVGSSWKHPDFHHVLTELAFLKARGSHNREKSQAVVPIDLEARGMEYLFGKSKSPIFDRSKLILNFESPTDRCYQHKRFFDLLGQLYPEQQDLIWRFQNCYLTLKERFQHVTGEKERKDLITREIDNTVCAATEAIVARYTELQSKMEFG